MSSPKQTRKSDDAGTLSQQAQPITPLCTTSEHNNYSNPPSYIQSLTMSQTEDHSIELATLSENTHNPPARAPVNSATSASVVDLQNQHFYVENYEAQRRLEEAQRYNLELKAAYRSKVLLGAIFMLVITFIAIFVVYMNSVPGNASRAH
ncbi:hypothetical protein PVAG01_05826 [Phlyctema vagabunda]|uniref:Transmembrane protein n=1 Tax=Phlyctema vagabunda TaxID=108571 RepID=A0ABR4PEF7_9HELO